MRNVSRCRGWRRVPSSGIGTSVDLNVIVLGSFIFEVRTAEMGYAP